MSDDAQPVNDPIAQVDQMIACMGDWASLMRSHFTKHVEAGFAPEQAFALTLAYQTALVQGAARA